MRISELDNTQKDYGYNGCIIDTVDNPEGIYCNRLVNTKSDWNVFCRSMHPCSVVRHYILSSDRRCDSTIYRRCDAHFIFAIKDISIYVHQLWQDFRIYNLRSKTVENVNMIKRIKLIINFEVKY